MSVVHKRDASDDAESSGVALRMSGTKDSEPISVKVRIKSFFLTSAARTHTCCSSVSMILASFSRECWVSVLVQLSIHF